MDGSEAELDGLLAQSCMLATTDYMKRGEEALRSLTTAWSSLTSSPIPTASQAYAALAARMHADGDLAPDQVDHFLSSWIIDTGKRSNWLQESAERLLLGIRPWFPLWVGFTQWAFAWSRQRKFDQLVFLGRDGLPLYAAARGLQAMHGSHLLLQVADVPRLLLDSPLLAHHLNELVNFSHRTVLVDSGCYGTAVTRVLKHAGDLRGNDDGVAVMFFASRNPRIFGYLNYLMCPHYLADCGAGSDRRGPFDFTIYAGDVLESVPKPYEIAVTASQVHRKPTDFASFVLSLRIYGELSCYAQAADECGFTEAARSASELYRLFNRGGAELVGAGMLLERPAPKAPPSAATMARLGITGIAPQSEIFGIDSG